MIKYIKKRIFIIASIFIFTVFSSLFGFGFFEYNNWLKTKAAISSGSCTYLCGGTATMVQTGCTQSCSGKCCCSFCDPLCNGSTQVVFNGQSICGVNFMCVGPNQEVKGTPIQMAAGKEFIACNTTANLFQGNGIIGTASFAASKFQRLVNAYDYIIAVFGSE